MTSPRRLDPESHAQRVAEELHPGEAVALGSGLPCSVVSVVPEACGIRFLADSGAFGYRPRDGRQAGSTGGLEGPVDSNGEPVVLLAGGMAVSTSDLAAIVRSGRVNAVVLQPAFVNSNGDFSHWTTKATAGLSAPANSVDLASGVDRVIAMMPHVNSEGVSSIVGESPLPVDGVGSVNRIITDVAVIDVTGDGLILRETALGWTAEEVVAVTSAPLAVAPGVKQMTFEPLTGNPPSKVYPNGPAAVQDIFDGAMVNIDGFGGPGGMAHHLLVSLKEQGAKDLTLISNTAGIARVISFGTPAGLVAIDHSILVDNNQVRKAISTYPVSPRASLPTSFELAYQRGEVELEVVPQGTLAERLRAGGAGVAAFYTPTAAGTLLAEGKETRMIGGKEHVLETGVVADFCLMRGHKADTLGNVTYRGTSRNFNAVMATAARVSIVEVDEIVEPGGLAPEEIVTPGIYIDRIVLRPPGFSPYE